MGTVRAHRFVILLTIVLLAACVRLWRLGSIPVSPDWDEVALGYNAYSLFKTGRDEYGTKFPFVLRSYDDYKPPLYMYLTIPSIALFGLETWAVRLPSAIAGVLAVLGTFFLVKELFRSSRLTSYISHLTSLLLAISPWHIQFSRIAFEANIGVTINIWAVWAFLKGLQQRKFLPFSAFLFGLGLYAYHSERIFVPLVVLLLTWIYRKELFTERKSVWLAIVIGALTVAPLLSVFINSSTIMRLRGTSSLADQTGLLTRSVRKLEEDQRRGNPWGIVFDNRRIVWAKTLVDGYLSHYSFKWLFLTGDNPRHHAPDMGLMYLWELPFLLWGMVAVARKGGALRWSLFGWFLLAPVAGSPTTGLPHAIRSLVFLPTFQIFTAVGIITAISNIKYQNLTVRGIGVLTILFLIVNISYYFHMYFGHTNREFSQYWQYGYEEAVRFAQDHATSYKKIVVSTKLEQPHMFFLFYTRYDPATYLAEGGTASGGFAELRNKFSLFEFRPIQWEKELKDGTILYVGTPQEIPGTSIKSIRYLDGSEAMRIAER